MKYLLLIACLLTIFNCRAQRIKKMSIPVINDKSEVLNIHEFSDYNGLNKNKLKIDSPYYVTSREDLLEVNNEKRETIISYSKSYNTDIFSGHDYSINPVIGIYKEFYSNKILKTKGLVCWFGFKIGLWYKYNEEGVLISTEDFDKGYDFTYDKVFLYCRDHNIPLEKKSSGNSTLITKSLSNDGSLYLWGISYPDYNKKIEKTLKLNAKDGSLTEEFERPLPLD